MLTAALPNGLVGGEQSSTAVISISEEAVRSHVIRTGRISSFNHWHRGDAQGHLGENGGLEDPLEAEEGHVHPVEGEAGGEEGPRQDFPVELRLLREEAERRQPDPLVEVTRATVHSSPFAGGTPGIPPSVKHKVKGPVYPVLDRGGDGGRAFPLSSAGQRKARWET